MKIVHTADWHLGKNVYGVNLIDDQQAILDELLIFLSLEKPDVLIIAGDIYDRSVPPTVAIELLDKTISHILREINCQIIIIAGNHDNPARLGFASDILAHSGLHIITDLATGMKPIRIDDFLFFGLPYLEPVRYREFFGDESLRSAEDGIRKVLSHWEEYSTRPERKILIHHGFVTAGEPWESESERQLGGAEHLPAELFQLFDYVALGHLHGPQQAGWGHIRYAGSLLKYSFSESLHQKSVSVIEFAPEISIRLHSLPVKRDMRRIRGSLADLIQNASGNRDDYIEAVLTDEGEIIDAIGKLRSVYPNTLSVRRATEDETVFALPERGREISKIPPPDLFLQFYKEVLGKEVPAGGFELLEQIWEEIERERRQE